MRVNKWKCGRVVYGNSLENCPVNSSVGSNPTTSVGSRYAHSIERRQDRQMPFGSFHSLV